MFPFCSMKVLLQKKKWKAFPGRQSSGPDRSPSSYLPKLAPSLLPQSIPTSRPTRATCAHLSAWQIILLTGTLSSLPTLLHLYSALCERVQDCISMLSFLLAVMLFHLPSLLKARTELCSDPVSFWCIFYFWGDGMRSSLGLKKINHLRIMFLNCGLLWQPTRVNSDLVYSVRLECIHSSYTIVASDTSGTEFNIS